MLHWPSCTPTTYTEIGLWRLWLQCWGVLKVGQQHNTTRLINDPYQIFSSLRRGYQDGPSGEGPDQRSDLCVTHSCLSAQLTVMINEALCSNDYCSSAHSVAKNWLRWNERDLLVFPVLFFFFTGQSLQMIKWVMELVQTSPGCSCPKVTLVWVCSVCVCLSLIGRKS